MGSKFDPKRFIDRENEQKLFLDMLNFQDVNVFIIEDPKANGKSHLLQQLKRRCVAHNFPHCLIALDEHQQPLKDLGEAAPLGLLKMIAAALTEGGITFPDFERKEAAMRSGNLNSLYNLPAPVVQNVTVQIGDDNFNENSGVINIVGIQNAGPNLDPQNVVTDRGKVVDAFFNEIKQRYDDDPMIIMIDAFERCNEIECIGDFINGTFLNRLVFNNATRPGKTLLVIAGQSGPDLALRTEEQLRRVSLASPMGKWNEQHVRQYMQAVDVNNEQLLDAAQQLLSIGYPIAEIVRIIEYSKRN